jgi:hypothetical protein
MPPGQQERHQRRPKSTGAISQRLLAERQARAMATVPDAVILVEGLSDCFAVEAAAARYGRNLAEESVVVVPMGGATNLARFLAHFGPMGLNVPLAGLCDLAELNFFSRTLHGNGITDRSTRAAMERSGFFICERDLEDELIRTLGSRRVEEVIKEEGELDSLRKLQQMPFHRGRDIDDHLHRFIGVRSGRKYRYAPLLLDALDGLDPPRSVHQLLAYV